MDNDTLFIFTDTQPEPSGPVMRGLKETLQQATTKAQAVAVTTLQDNMCRFLNSLDAILKASPKEVGGLTLDEVEIHVQIDGKGNVGIQGIVGAESTTQAGIKFVLRKKV